MSYPGERSRNSHDRRDAGSGPGTPSGHRTARARARKELFARRQAAVSNGVGTTFPVFIERAGGGVLVDVDGNSLIDLGSGIAVVSVGNSAPRVVAGRHRPGRRLHPHLFHDHAVRGLRRGLRAAGRAHPGHPREEVRAVQLRLRGRRERGQDRPARHRPHRDRGVRPRLPRPHQPDDGADREEHALQGGLRPVRPRGLPGADVLPATGTATSPAQQAAAARHRHHHHPGRRLQRGRRADRADPGRGRLHRARRRASCRPSPPGARTTARC